MRVISGKNRGFHLKMVPTKLTRPTTDKVKEAMFSMINTYIDKAKVLDLYAGSGALGIESLSRGACMTYFVDKMPLAIKTIKSNLKFSKNYHNYKILRKPAGQALKIFQLHKIKFNLIFLDPPYAKQHVVKDLFSMYFKGLLMNNCVIICETNRHGFNFLEDNLPNMFNITKRKRYGITYLTICKLKGNGD